MWTLNCIWFPGKESHSEKFLARFKVIFPLLCGRFGVRPYLYFVADFLKMPTIRLIFLVDYCKKNTFLLLIRSDLS